MKNFVIAALVCVSTFLACKLRKEGSDLMQTFQPNKVIDTFNLLNHLSLVQQANAQENSAQVNKSGSWVCSDINMRRLADTVDTIYARDMQNFLNTNGTCRPGTVLVIPGSIGATNSSISTCCIKQ